MVDTQESKSPALYSVDPTSRLLKMLIYVVISLVIIITITTLMGWTTWPELGGVTLGGGLAVLNFHWLRSSVANIFDLAVQTASKPSVNPVWFVLRYVAVGVVVATVWDLKLVSVPALLWGLSAFAVVGLAEAGWQIYQHFTISED